MNTHALSDAKLVSLYINGDEGAFEQLVNKSKARVFTTIYLIVRDKGVAEDLLQDTYIKTIRTIKSGRYNEEGKFLPWIIRIANNLAIDYFRREKRYPKVSVGEGDGLFFNSLKLSQAPAESDQIKNETHKELRKLIKELPETQKEVLTMRHYGEMSFKEIAEATGVSINTALGRMRYALINLRKKMQAQNIAYEPPHYSR